MRKRYKTTFLLGTPAEPAALEDAARLCVAWATSRNRSAAQELPIDRDVLETSGAFGKVKTVRVDDAGGALWGIEARTPDASDSDLTWVTEITLARHTDRLAFTCSNGFSSSGVLRPTRRPPSRPGIVADVIRDLGAHRQFALAARPHVLGATRTRDFIARLVDPARTRPVILVSARNWDDRPVLDAGPIADQLAGLAHVFVAEDRFPSLEMPRLFPKPLCCWDGAVRLYWPRLKANDRPTSHPHWPVDEIERINEERAGGFTEYLLAQVAQHAVYAVDPDEVSISDIEARRYRSQMAELLARDQTQPEDVTRLLNEAEGWLREKDDEIARLRQELASLDDVYRRERQRSEAYRAALENRSAPEAPPPDLPIETVEAALDRAAADFPNKLVIALNSKSVVKRSEFDEPEELYQALEWLATTYHDAKIGTAPVADLDASIRDACAWTYKGDQTDVTLGRFAEWYQAHHDGQRYELRSHVRTRGNSRDPRRSMSVGFAWDGDREAVIVGYVGQHQRNTFS
ncbi:MAG: hypothetical protein H6709_02210 [Kofleriaceae bacterium]|nr:hypothetical protein [Myxococcales bacterium]MCB9570885.1 hypothetical protein [Kofleriaceae bacterium]